MIRIIKWGRKIAGEEYISICLVVVVVVDEEEGVLLLVVIVVVVWCFLRINHHLNKWKRNAAAYNPISVVVQRAKSIYCTHRHVH